MKKTIAYSIGLLSALTCVAADGPLDTYTRSGKSEIDGFGTYIASGAEFRGLGITGKFGSGYGGGVAFGIFANNHFRISTDIGGTGVDYTATNGRSVVTGQVSMLNWNVGVDCNILTTRLTPVISAKVGVTHLASDGLAGSASETDFSYGVGGGVRYDITDHLSAKLSYLANWTNLKDSDGATLFHTFTFGLGYTF